MPHKTRRNCQGDPNPISDSTDDSSCSEDTTSCPTVVIGDTAGAVLAADKIKNKKKSFVNYVFEGTDNLSGDPYVTNINHAIKNTQFKLHHFRTQQIHYIGPDAGDSCSEDHSDNDLQVTSRVIHHLTGNGPSGDLIGISMVDFGPWIPSGPSKATVKAIHAITTKVKLSKLEKQVQKHIKHAFKLHETDQVVVNQPSVANVHNYLITEEAGDEDFTRNLFNEEYTDVVNSNRASVFSNAKNIDVEPATGNRFNVTLTSNREPKVVRNAKVIWATDPHTYVRLRDGTHLPKKSLKIATEYASFTPVKRTDIINIKCAKPMSDGILARGTYSTGNLDSENHQTVISWAVEWSLGSIDLPTLNFADTCQDFLLVSLNAVNFHNKRTLTFDRNNEESLVYFNSEHEEAKFSNQFKKHISEVFKGLTGNGPGNLEMFQEFTRNGAVTEVPAITSTPGQSTNVATVVRTITGLVGGGIGDSAISDRLMV